MFWLNDRQLPPEVPARVGQEDAAAPSGIRVSHWGKLCDACAELADSPDMDFSAGYLIATLITSSVGFSLFLYGKKQARIPQLGVGVVLMVMPYFGGGAWWIAGSAVMLCLALWLAVRRGL